MKTVLCSLNSQYIHSSLAPWCLLAGIRAFGDTAIDAVVAEGTINESPEAVAARVIAQHPDAVGFSCYIWNIRQVQAVAAQVKRELPHCFVFFGGPEVSYCAERVLADSPFVDAVVCGEGEMPVARLLTALCRGDSLYGLAGVAFRDGGETVPTEPYLTEQEPPSPYLPEYFDALQGRIAYLETSRGCPFSCAFCLSGRCGGVRFYPMERVKRELLLLANSGTQTVKLVDRTFNANRARAREIWRFLIDGYGTAFPKTVCFHFEIGGDLLTEEDFVLLSEAPKGLFQMEIGLQSFHAPTLGAIRRKTDTDALIDNIQKLVVAGNVHTHIDLIAGLPLETIDTFADGVNRAISLQPHMLQLGFLKLLHGAPMREETSEFPCTFCTEAPYEVTSTPWMSEADLTRLHGIEQALDRMYNSGRFRRTLQYVMQTTALSAFDVFSAVADACADTAIDGISLDAYTTWLFNTFSQMTDVDALRDVMILDRLSANPSGLLPVCLRQYPEQTKRLKALAEQDLRFARPQGVQRGACCLSDGKRLAYADRRYKDPVTGCYPVRIFVEACVARPYTTLLFDLDGTITDPAEGITNAVSIALAHFGIEVPDKTVLHPFIGPPLLDSFRDFYGFDEQQCAEALKQYRSHYGVKGIYENAVYEGIPALLYDLKAHGYRLLVATSKPEMYARRIFNKFGLTEYFDVIAGSDMAEKRANKAAVVSYALEQAHLTSKDEALMIGDTRFDVLGAKAEGLACLGVAYGYGTRDELEQAGAAYVVDTVDELRAFLLD